MQHLIENEKDNIENEKDNLKEICFCTSVEIVSLLYAWHSISSFLFLSSSIFSETLRSDVKKEEEVCFL